MTLKQPTEAISARSAGIFVRSALQLPGPVSATVMGMDKALPFRGCYRALLFLLEAAYDYGGFQNMYLLTEHEILLSERNQDPVSGTDQTCRWGNSNMMFIKQPW